MQLCRSKKQAPKMIPANKEDKISKERSGLSREREQDQSRLSTVLSKLDRDLQHAEEVDINMDKQSLIFEKVKMCRSFAAFQLLGKIKFDLTLTQWISSQVWVFPVCIFTKHEKSYTLLMKVVKKLPFLLSVQDATVWETFPPHFT